VRFRAPIMRILIVEEGTRSRVEFEQDIVRVGRALDNEIRLNGPKISRHHCQLEEKEDGVWLVDLSSANGTVVNGARVDRRLLGPGDEVEVGAALLSLEGEGAGEFDALQTLTGEETFEPDRLHIFAQVTQALLGETEEAPLLRLIVDSALQLSGGERGFILVRDEARTAGRADDAPPELSVRVARLYDKSDIPVPSSRLSQGIAARVATSGESLLSVDASHDERFGEMASVEDLRLRSVMCVPVTRGGRVDGVLYVDNRMQRGAFAEDDLEVLELLAGQAALAIRNANLLAELRVRNERLVHSTQQIQQLNDRLGRKVRDRDTELAVVRAELGRERGRYDYTDIVGASDGMRRIFQSLDRIVESELPVLIAGESGTGKELIARAIHFNGPRSAKPFICENCAALPDTLLESELFGHTRGAFTGADRAKKGLLEQADGGTLFLDEIGDMSAEMQKKLLRVLQEGEVRPLGSDRVVHVDVRLLAASNRDLSEMVRQGTFREDLFYRVNVLHVGLPSLRERREDIPLLAEHLLARAAREAGASVPLLPHEVVAALAAYDWPGNVRELENEMRRLIVLAGDTVRLEHLSDHVLQAPGGGLVEVGSQASVAVTGDLRAAVANFEERAIHAALAGAEGNKSRAAAALGISRFALQRKLEKYRGDQPAEAGGDE